MTKSAGMPWSRYASSMAFELICMHVVSNVGFVAMGASVARPLTGLPGEVYNSISSWDLANS